MIEYSYKGDIQNLIRLIEDKSLFLDINHKDIDNWTALHHACNEGHEEIVQLLVKKKANLNC